MKRILASCCSLLILGSWVTPVEAQEFKILGLRALGMGGSQVALAEGGLTQYWNPGNLAFQKRFDMEAPVSVNVEATGNILDKASDISDLADKIQSLQSAQSGNSSITLSQVEDFADAANKITDLNQDGSGVLAGVQGGGNLRLGRLAVSLNNFTEVGATPFVDSRMGLGSATNLLPAGDASLNASLSTADRDALASVITDLGSTFGATIPGNDATQVANKLMNEAWATGRLTTDEMHSVITDAQQGVNDLQNLGIDTGGGDFKDNRSNVSLRGSSLTEFAVGYGIPLPIPDRLGQLGLGGSLKLIRGVTGFKRVDLTSGQEADLADFSKNQKTTVKPSIDIGAFWRTPLPWKTRFGVVVHDVNSPKFDQPEAGVAAGEPAYKQEMQARAGLACQPIRILTIASDIDLTQNKTSIPTFASRHFGAGAELNLWLLKLRAGLLKNVEGGTPLAYTAGVGLKIFMVALDIGAAVSSKTVRFKDGTEIPSTVQAGLNLGIVFGGRKG